ncbi:zn 2cys6 transcription factor [Diplodia corticola]|uniref:Zn 2cys6 transcription factor n=1 Tax=Diplodia corticola TaxID=236234 RepID=A0A1J9RW67_9PEZI|nr:zn 2cys6 transcription factor [Diplodia corticola]OJD32084.1 zn 2cys6 transcription factor [Diplodia corticola]
MESWTEKALVAGYQCGLAWIGYDRLWRVPVRNGSLLAIGRVMKTGRFANGSTLLRRYTGVPALDRRLETAVVFYTDLVDPRNDSAERNRLLLVQVHSTMQATAFCMLAATRHGPSPRPLQLLIPAAWGMINQFWGAAFVYPLYLALDGGSAATPMNHAAVPALLLSACVGALVPLALLYPAYAPSCPAKTRQRSIALYRLAPIAYVVMHLGLEHMAPTLLGPASVPPAAPYLAAGLVAAAAHLYSVSAALTRNLLALVYWPAGPSPSTRPANVVPDAAHLFLWYDLAVIAPSFFVPAYTTLLPVAATLLGVGPIVLALLLLAATVVLGPAPVLCFAYAARATVY